MFFYIYLYVGSHVFSLLQPWGSGGGGDGVERTQVFRLGSKDLHPLSHQTSTQDMLSE